MELPRYSPHRKVGENGLAIVKKIVEDDLQWIFRKVPLDDDFGLDGYIDIIEDGTYVTGKSIGVQIKTGLSFFKNQASSGWVFYGEKKHLNYYLNIEIPVIIILVNPETQDVYWSKVDLNLITKSKNGWKIVVQESLKLVNKDKLKLITNTYIDYTSQLENLDKIGKAMLDSGSIFVAINRDEIENKNYEGFDKMLKWLTASDEMIIKNRGKLFIAIYGYDEDLRELFQIEEVRNWIKEVVPRFKYWGYFLHMDKPVQQNSGLTILLYCFIDIKKAEFLPENRHWKIEYDVEQSNQFVLCIFNWLNEFAKKYKIDEKIVFEQSMKIHQIINGISDHEISQKRKEYGFD